jgi:hypothetical protein
MSRSWATPFTFSETAMRAPAKVSDHAREARRDRQGTQPRLYYKSGEPASRASEPVSREPLRR